MALTIGVDVGGTTVAAGVVDEQGRVLATAMRDVLAPPKCVHRAAPARGPRHYRRGARRRSAKLSAPRPTAINALVSGSGTTGTPPMVLKSPTVWLSDS